MLLIVAIDRDIMASVKAAAREGLCRSFWRTVTFRAQQPQRKLNTHKWNEDIGCRDSEMQQRHPALAAADCVGLLGVKRMIRLIAHAA